MLQISNLSFSYPQKDIFTQANLTISQSQIIAIIGDNGEGKTTFLKLLTGELHPDDGAIRLDGKVGYLAQTHDHITDKSGGEKTKLALASLFSQDYDILLLDEPTNNLDTVSQQWLLHQLRNFRGLILLVSHDRHFINQIAQQILEIKNQQLQLYEGNYADYVARQTQLHNEQLADYQKAQQLKSSLHHQIQTAHRNNSAVSTRRFNKTRDESKLSFHSKRAHAQNTAGRTINAAKSKLAQLGDVTKPYERKTYTAKLSADFLRHRRLLKVSELSKSYPAKTLFQNLTFEIYTGERLRIAGDNGTGKTTLFKIILGQIPTDSGQITLAPNLSLGYISQEVFGLDLSQTFLAQTDSHPTDIFQAAATMDLTKTDLTTPIYNLSRGQITKLSFLKIILHPIDLLILDEPTNHLDLRARNNLESALVHYPGAILFATHDETFAHNLHPDNILLLT